MSKGKKSGLRILLTFLVFIPIAAFAHYFLFPEETKSILIDFSHFKKEGRIYFNPATKESDIKNVEYLIDSAAARVGLFWSGRKSNPKFIYCDQKGDYLNYSVNGRSPAVTYCKLGTYIVLSKDGVDIDIIAHELSHAELYSRVGFYNWNYGIPDWFKHGLAMQNDYRSYYSTDTLRVRTDNFKNMPDITQFKTGKQFYSGSVYQVMLRYMAARYVVGQWYSTEKLNKLIEDLNAGKSFDDAFKK